MAAVPVAPVSQAVAVATGTAAAAMKMTAAAASKSSDAALVTTHIPVAATAVEGSSTRMGIAASKALLWPRALQGVTATVATLAVPPLPLPDNPTALDFEDALEPWMNDDYRVYARIVGGMFAEVEELAADRDDGTPGWSAMLDPDLAPSRGLPYLAQWRGERLPEGIADAAARQWIKDNPNGIRGTITAMARAAQRTLDPDSTAQVMINEQHKLDGTFDVDHIAVVTLVEQTPDPAATLAAILSVSMADLVVEYQAQSGATWAEIQAEFPTWEGVRSANPTWEDVQGAIGGWSVFTR